MWTTVCVRRQTFLAALLWMSPVLAGSLPDSLDQGLISYLSESHYTGATLATVREGSLLTLRSYGTTSSGKQNTAHTSVPMPGIGRLVAKMVVLLLAQLDKISLHDKVFGEYGILNTTDLQPITREGLDLYDITVSQLLRHEVVWGDKHWLYKQLMTSRMLDNKHSEPGVSLYPQTFSPEELEYLLLHMLAETASGLSYHHLVHTYLLQPCGMWNTRLMPARDERTASQAGTGQSIQVPDPRLSPKYAGLQWQSNIYDIVRFMRCTFDRQELLSGPYLALFLNIPPGPHDDGFYKDAKGNIWQQGGTHATKYVLYHDAEGSTPTSMPDSWVLLLYGDSDHNVPLHTLGALFMTDQPRPAHNLFLEDLSDLRRDSQWEPSAASSDEVPQYIIKYQIDHWRLPAYVNAAQQEGFDVTWFTSYSLVRTAYFLVVSEFNIFFSTSPSDCVLQHDMDHRQLLKRKLQLEESGYNMTHLHSYKRSDHLHNSLISFSAIFRRDAFPAETQMKYGTRHLAEPYDKLLQMYHEKSFQPISQTVVFVDGEEQFSFIFIKQINADQIEFKHYYDISPSRLAKIATENADAGLALSYVNSYEVAPGKFRLAAIFSNTTEASGVLLTDLAQQQVSETTQSNLQKGFKPRFIVPYFNEDSQLRMVLYLEDKQSL